MSLLFVALIPFLIGGIGLAATPIALGSWHWLARLAALFAVSAFIGLIPPSLNVTGEVTTGLSLGAILIAAGLSTSSSWTRVPLTAIGMIFLICSLWMVPWRAVDFSSVLRVLAAIGFVSLALLSLRVLGYRLVDLCPDGGSRDFQLGTGRELDDWCRLLDAELEFVESRPQIVELLRREGLDFTWADTVAKSYERYRGKCPVAAHRDGPCSLADHQLNAQPFWQTLGANVSFRFSIANLMAWSAVIAAVLGFARFFAQGFPTTADVVYGLPIIFMLSVITVASCVTALSVVRDRRTLAACVGILVVVSVAAPFLLQMNGFLVGPFSVASVAILFASLVMYGGFSLARNRGYRLLRFQSPSGGRSATTPIAISDRIVSTETDHHHGHDSPVPKAYSLS